MGFAKIVDKNFGNVLSEAFYTYVKSSSENSLYACLSWLPDSEHADYLTKDWNDIIDSDLFVGGLNDSEFDIRDEEYYFQTAISLHKLYQGGVSRIIPRQDWTYGEVYKAWPQANSFVLVKEYILGYPRYNVYNCLFSTKQPSLYSPVGAATAPVKTADGYIWRYMYSIDNAAAFKFLTSSWMPILEPISASEASDLVSGSASYDLYVSQSSATPFEVYSIETDMNDSDLYISLTDTAEKRRSVGFSDVQATDSEHNWPVKFNFKLTGKDVVSTSPVSKEDAGTSKFEVEIDYDSDRENRFAVSLTQAGSGYYGPITLEAFDSEVAVTIDEFYASVAPAGGHGADIAKELSADAVMLNIKVVPDPDEAHTKLMKGTQFNLSMLVENPIDTLTGLPGHRDFYVACHKAQMDSDAPSWMLENKFLDGGTEVKVVAVDGRDTYFIFPNYGDAYSSVSDGQTFNNTSGVNHPDDRAIAKVYDREVIFSGSKVLMAEFKEEDVFRSEDQVENLNFIIRF
ncbi:MAG: hypothetical protein N0C84_00875 [Candidatus Thiodiazotropha taylori]|uniref:Uncharacterized protein n=1 Tax=Candidatus Thiodiazotropha taylori TaxID=2792791 RepID=A0A9E4KA32_9GAMM|nr:hypothetical protein [Candidatus Thiodiazotropha taylori]MCW4254998.1 hypothetical protein [Candidatus Thiodiazotropha taylori]